MLQLYLIAIQFHTSKIACKFWIKRKFFRPSILSVHIIYPADIPKTAVITLFGLFEIPVMIFGLCNAAQTFRQFTSKVLFGLDFCVPYFDDVLVTSSSEEEHLTHLGMVFERFQSYTVSLNPNKYLSGQPKVSFLAHEFFC